MEVGGWKFEVGGWKFEVGSWRLGAEDECFLSFDFLFGTYPVVPYFCTPLSESLGLAELPDSIMVVRQILVLFVLVRIQVGQQKTKWLPFGKPFVFLASYIT